VLYVHACLLFFNLLASVAFYLHVRTEGLVRDLECLGEHTAEQLTGNSEERHGNEADVERAVEDEDSPARGNLLTCRACQGMLPIMDVLVLGRPI